MAAIGAYTQKMIASGTVLMTGGLVRPTKGTQIKCEGAREGVVERRSHPTRERVHAARRRWHRRDLAGVRDGRAVA